MRRLRVFVLGTRGFPDIQGGVEKHCQELYPRLVELGCQITVIARTPYIQKVNQIPEWRGIKFIYLWCPKQKYLEAIVHTFLGVVTARIKSPDILHIHAIGPSILVLLAKIMGLRVVVTNHGPDYEREKWGRLAKAVLRTGELVSTQFADKVIVISKVIRDVLENKYGRKDLEMIPNGVSSPLRIETTQALKEYHLRPSKYVFTAARFVPEKGLHDLIGAYQKIKNSEFKLVIAGDADHETIYSRKIKRLAKEGQGIVLTGFISGKPLAELFSNAGLFVLASYYEGLPMVLLEAMSYGLPVLVSDIPANREVPLPDFRYFRVGNIDVLSKKMVELYREGISKEEKQRHREILMCSYDWDKITEETLSVYRKALRSEE